jgi:hypothetical protein
VYYLLMFSYFYIRHTESRTIKFLLDEIKPVEQSYSNPIVAFLLNLEKVTLHSCKSEK